MINQDIVQSLIKRFEAEQSRRSTFDMHWEETAKLVFPSFSGTFYGTLGSRTPGDKRTESQYDSTAARGLVKFAAFMESMLVPRNMRWHSLRAEDDDVNKLREVQLWMERATDVLFKWRYSPRSNFASVYYETFLSLGAFGNGIVFIDEHMDGVGIRYKQCPLGSTYFLENHQGMVDTVFRPFKMTVRQAVQKWGKDALPQRIAGKLDNAPETEFNFLHIVAPREDIVNGSIGYKGMPFASYYCSIDDKVGISEGGFRTFPYPVARYIKAPDEFYARGPAMMALPDIKSLNEEKKTLLKQGQRIVDPVLLAHDDGVIDTFSLQPGAVNAGGMSAEGRPLIGVLPTGNISAGLEMMQYEQAGINDHFLVTLFQILVDSPQMTATEVIERAREKGALLSPTMGRQQSELLGPNIERELDILARQGKLPPMPDALRESGGSFTVQYDSPLSRAQRAEQAAGFMRALETAINWATATQDPSPLDHFDVDVVMPQLADIDGMPASWRRSMKTVAAIRANRQQAQATQNQIDAAPALAGIMKAAQSSNAG